MKEVTKLQEVRFTSVDSTDIDHANLINVAENLRDHLRDLIRHKDFQLKNKLQKQLNKIRNSGDNEKTQNKRQRKSVAFTEEKEEQEMSDDEEIPDMRESNFESSEAQMQPRRKRNKRIKINWIMLLIY